MDYRFLRGLSAKPRVHPNGFVQLDIGENEKLHVWPETPLKTVNTETPMHDHTFSFASEVLVGTLIHTVWTPVEHPAGDYRLWTVAPYKAIDKVGPMALLDDKRYHMNIKQDFIICAGETYRFAALEFHSSYSVGLTATHIRINPYDKSQKARITCRHDRAPQLFDRHQIDEELLWSIIQKVFQG